MRAEIGGITSGDGDPVRIFLEEFCYICCDSISEDDFQVSAEYVNKRCPKCKNDRVIPNENGEAVLKFIKRNS